MELTPLVGTETLHPNSQRNETPQLEYSKAAKDYILFRRQRLIAARDTRDMRHEEFDDMGFLKWHDVMKKADDQYVAPRKNAQDTAINLGTIRDKDTTLVEYACKYDFEPVAQVFDDEDEMLEELAETVEDMVRKSLLLEEDKEKAKLIYRSMVAFGTALVEEQWVERWIIQKTLKQGYNPSLGSTEAEWTEQLVKQYDGCQQKLWDLRKCYFGDIRKFFMNGPQGQPFFFTVEYEPYDVVKAMFGNWDRFKYVSTNLIQTPEVTDASTYNDSWTLRPITQNYVEIVRYYDPIANEFALTLNGADMLPIMTKKKKVNGIEKEFISGFPLTEISPSGAINFAKYDLEPMHDFAYSKPQPAKMRVMANVKDMMMKLFIGMVKQKAKPTLGNRGGRTFGPEVTDPATVINDIREGDLFPVLPNFQGLTTSDFSFYEMIDQELSRNSVEDSLQGRDGSDPNKPTATQDMNSMKAQTLQVAALFDGIISGRKQAYWLRTYTIARYWTKPVDQQIDVVKKALIDKYRTISVGTKIDGGQKAVKKIVFTKDTTMDSEQVHQEEMDMGKEKGGEVRIAYLHPEKFRQMCLGMKLSWFYSCVPVPNGSDPLSYLLFAKQVVDAQTFFGNDSLNVKRLKHRFASITGNDFDTWFISEQELDQKRQQAQMAEAAAGGPETASKAQPTPMGAAAGAGAAMGALQ